jgi:hypothetical protein
MILTVCATQEMKRINSGRQKWQSQANDTRIYTHTVYCTTFLTVSVHIPICTLLYSTFIYSVYKGIQSICLILFFFASPSFMLPVLLTYEIATMTCTAKNQCRKSETNIPRKVNAQPQSQFHIHVSVSNL